jgi:phosphoribosylamine--glycine ligase
VLYVGLMLTSDGPQVIEFNVRFGDPEAQVVLPMIEAELAPVLLAAAQGDLSTSAWRVTDDPHVGVVIASGGYPGAYQTGFPIQGLTEAVAVPGVVVFHAGSAFRDNVVVTSGGRVLTVVARGTTFEDAIAHAYEAVGRISFSRAHHRTDIGRRAISR